MPSLKSLYRAQLDQKQSAEKAQAEPLARAKTQLAGLYRSIVDDREFYEALRAEVELFDDDLRIDPGPIMIVITPLESGEFRMEYEVKRSDDYQSTVLPEVRTIADVELAVAKLLVEYHDED